MQKNGRPSIWNPKSKAMSIDSLATARVLPKGGWRATACVIAGLVLHEPLAAADNKLIDVQPLSELQIPIVYSAPAETVSLQQTRISAEIDARIIAMPARRADQIAADAILAELDCRDYQLSLKRAHADLKAARAQLKLAEQRLQRTSSLGERKLASQDLLDQRQTELEAASATVESWLIQVEQAETEVSRCVIRSPFRAAVVERHAGVGEFARTGTPLFDLQDLDRVEVSAQIVPNEIASLAEAPEIFLEFLGRKHVVEVNRISPVIDTMTRTQEVRLAFTATPAPVGASGRLAWIEHNPALPAHLLVQRDGKLGIFTVEQTEAKFLALPGAVEGRPVAVKLPADTRIVTNGRHNLQSGDQVKLDD